MPPLNFNHSGTAFAKIASSTTVQDLVVENGHRTGLYIYNNSTANLFVRIDGDATLTDFSFMIPANTLYEMPNSYFSDRLSGIWATANGFAHITEIR